MDLYLEIQQHLREEKPLSEMIASVYSSLLPKRKFRADGLTEQQCLALVYEHLRAPLARLRERVETQVKDDHVTEEEVPEAEEGEGEEEGQGQEEEVNEEDMGQEENEEEEIGQEEENSEQLLDRKGDDEMLSQEDVGLYGQQLDQQEMESYENEEMEDDPQFGNFNLNKMEDKAQLNQGQKQDEYIEDNFDQFRQIQLQNQETLKKQPATDLQKQIQKFQQRAMQTKNWILGGQVKAKQRPVNSLIDTELEYKSGIKYTHQITESYNTSLEDIIKQRILDQIYDDRVRIVPNTSMFKNSRWERISTEKSSQGLAQLYEIQFKNHLGIGGDKNQRLKKDIMDSLKEVNYYLDSLSNTGFALKPTASLQKNGAEAIILEDKVPVTSWNGGIEASKVKSTFQSQKEINTKTKRLRNKRNARQRKKEQDKKKMHRSIQYGGMTKIQAEARKKIAKTKLDTKSIKYSKSSSFFNNINSKTKPGKPNPNLSKLKI